MMTNQLLAVVSSLFTISSEGGMTIFLLYFAVLILYFILFEDEIGKIKNEVIAGFKIPVIYGTTMRLGSLPYYDSSYVSWNNVDITIQTIDIKIDKLMQLL